MPYFILEYAIINDISYYNKNKQNIFCLKNKQKFTILQQNLKQDANLTTTTTTKNNTFTWENQYIYMRATISPKTCLTKGQKEKWNKPLSSDLQ